MKNRLLYVPAGILFGGILALGVNAIAENTELDTGPRIFPYNGALEFNGEAVNGNVDLEFTLTDEADCNFTEEHDNVPVFSGRFTTNIGSVEGDVPTCVFDADEVYIQIAVREADSEGAFTALLGQQRIHPVPFAYWAAEGSDFKIDGNANIGGNATVGNSISINNNATIGGDVSASTATISGNATVGGNLGVGTAPASASVFRAHQLSMDSESGTGLFNIVAGASRGGSGYTYHDTRGASRILMGDGELGFFVGAGSNDGQAEGDDVSFDNPLEINANGLNNPDGDLTINDNLDITGNIQDTNGAVVIDDNLDVRGNLFDNNSEVIINDDMIVNQNATITGNLSVNGQLNLADVDVDQNTSGCMRLSTVQICWGRLFSSQMYNTVTFPKAFGSTAQLSVTLTASNGGDGFMRHLAADDVTTTTFVPEMVNNNADSRTDTGAYYMAIGIAGDNW